MISFESLNDSFRKNLPVKTVRCSRRSAWTLGCVVTTLVALSFAGVGAQWMTPAQERVKRQAVYKKLRPPCAGKVVPGEIQGEIEFRGQDGSRWRLDRRAKRWEPLT